MPKSKRSIIYVDGFNFYYGLLRSPRLRKCKWLDFEKLFRRLRPHDDLRLVKYFTAYWRDASGERHRVYTRALAQSPFIQVIEGRYKRKTTRCRVASCQHSGSREYTTFEEKETDVNIGLHILDDGYRDSLDVLVLVSADSDLLPALAMFRERFPLKQIVVYIPGPRSRYDNALELRAIADSARVLPANMIPHCLLPNEIQAPGGQVIRKPANW